MGNGSAGYVLAAAAVPVIITAVGSGLASGISITAAGALAFSAANFALGAAIGGALALVGTLLAPKPPSPSALPFAQQASQGRTRQFRQPITSWKWVVGDVRVSGPLTFIESTDDDKYLHMVVTLACHPCDAWKTVYLNDYPIYPEDLDGSDVVSGGRYDGKVKIQVDLGTSGSQPFPDLSADASGWTSAHRQDNHTKIYVRLEFDRDVFPSGIPDVSVRLRGRKDITDPRDSSTGWTCNPALLIRRYMTESELLTGMGIPTGEIDDTDTNASANVCDEIVDAKAVSHTVATVNVGSGSPISGGSFDLNGDLLRFMTGDRVRISSGGSVPAGFTAGTDYYVIADREQSTDDNKLRIRLAASLDDAYAETAITVEDAGSGSISIEKNGEPRFTAHGTIESDREPVGVLEDLRSAMAGWIPNIGGKWRIRAGYWETATVTLDEGDMAGPISVRTRVPRRERFNAVKGVYASPLNFGQPADYPVVTNSVYQTADGGERVFNELDLPFTNRPQTAQRIATIQLQRSRREIEATLRLNLIGLKLSATDTVKITNERYGWTAKTFRIVGWRFANVGGDGFDENNPPRLGVEIDVKEEDSTVYDFDENAEETIVTPAARTNLPDPYTVANPTSFAVTTDEFLTDNGTLNSTAVLTWTAPVSQFVASGGRIEVQHRRDGEADWSPSFFVDGSETRHRIPNLEADKRYDFRIRSVNGLNVRARTWQEINGYTIGAASEGAAAARDYGPITGIADVIYDRGGVAAVADKTLDYEEVV